MNASGLRAGLYRPITWPRLELQPALVLCGLVLALFADAVFRGHTLYERDLHMLWFSQTESFVRCVAAGSWPLWDPYIGFGRPLIANPSAQALYPWTWLNLLAPPAPVYTFYAASHLLIAGLGLYALARQLEITRAGALVAASLWVASGPLLSYVSLWHHLAGAAWLPWVVLALDRTARAPGPRSAIVCGVLFGVQLLAGSADMCIMTLLVGALFCMRHVAWRRPWVGNARIAAAAASAVLLGIGLAAAQWLPAIALASSSARRGLTGTVRMFWSLHPLSLVQTLVPAFAHELPISQAQRVVLFEGREPFLSSLYLGAASLPLVFASLSGRFNRLAWLLAVVVAGAMLVALGRFGVLYPWAAELFPPVRMLRYPVKVMILAAFGWALLGGLGADTWRRADVARRRLLPAVGAALACSIAIAMLVWVTGGRDRSWLPSVLSPDALAAGAEAYAPASRRLTFVAAALAAAACIGVARIATRVRPERLAAALSVLAVLDLYWSHRRLNPTAPEELILRRPQIATILPAGARLYVFDYGTIILGKSYRRLRGLDASEPVDGLPPELRGALTRLSELSPPVGARWGFYGSYEADLLSLDPVPVRNLAFFLRATEETPGFLRLMQVGAVQFVLGRHTEGLEALPPYATVSGVSGRPIRAFVVPDPLPRVSLVGRARTADGLPALHTLVDPAFDPHREVLLPSPAVDDTTGPFSGHIEVIEARPDRLRLRTVATRAGYVVVSDAHSMGWHATIDGRPEAVLRANVGFRAVRVPGGDHEVDLRYWPTGLTAGLWISVISCATVGAAALRLPRSRRT